MKELKVKIEYSSMIEMQSNSHRILHDEMMKSIFTALANEYIKELKDEIKIEYIPFNKEGNREIIAKLNVITDNDFDEFREGLIEKIRNG